MTNDQIDQLAKDLSRPNYLQFISVMLTLAFSVFGVLYISFIYTNNLKKHLSNIVGVYSE